MYVLNKSTKVTEIYNMDAYVKKEISDNQMRNIRENKIKPKNKLVPSTKAAGRR